MDGSYTHNKEHYLVAPFADEKKLYKCECDSCKLSFQYHETLPRLFWIGFLVPLTLLCEIGIYFYIDVYLNHRILQPNLNDIDLPTEYERQKYLERHEIIMETKGISREDLELEDNVLTDDSTGDIEVAALSHYRYEFLKQVATDVVDSHDYYRHYFLIWTLRSLGVLIGQTIVIVIVAVLCTK